MAESVTSQEVAGHLESKSPSDHLRPGKFGAPMTVIGARAKLPIVELAGLDAPRS